MISQLKVLIDDLVTQPCRESFSLGKLRFLNITFYSRQKKKCKCESLFLL